MSFEEQIMPKDKYLSTILLQMVAIVFIILQIFFATRVVLKIGEYPRIFPSFSWGILTSLDPFRPIARERKYLMHSGAIIGDGDRKRAPFLILGSSP